MIDEKITLDQPLKVICFDNFTVERLLTVNKIYEVSVIYPPTVKYPLFRIKDDQGHYQLFSSAFFKLIQIRPLKLTNRFFV